MRNIQLQFTLGGILILTAIARAESPGLFHRGLDEARNGNCQAAEADLKNAVPTGPEEVEALTAIGVCESSAGRPQLATGSFEAVTRLQPRAWQAWNNLGANYLALNCFDSAAQAFRKAIVINPRLNIAEVAELCGFCNPAYFASVFKKYAHCTPREFAIQPQVWKPFNLPGSTTEVAME